jgi:hypothetical protein
MVTYNNIEFKDNDSAIEHYSEQINLKRAVALAIDAAYSEIFDQMREHNVPKEIAEKLFNELSNDLTIDCY